MNIAIAGGIAGFSASLLLSPLDRLKIELQNLGKIPNLTFRYLYWGFGPTALREMGGFAVYFSAYEWL